MNSDINDNIFVPKSEYLKCAPSKIYSDGSCFSIESLVKIAKAYNEKFKDNQIIISDSKEKLVKELTKKITSCNNDQICWLNLKWIKELKDDDINNNTFRPKGPQGRFKWLSTTDINDVVTQYENKYNNFKFFGAVPMDFADLYHLETYNLDIDELVYNQKKTKIGMVVNLDEHWQRGSHWVGLYADLQNNQIYYFDSYGVKPKKKICDFVKKLAIWCYKRNVLKINETSDENFNTESIFMKSTLNKNKYEKIMDIQFNKTRHQYGGSECGVYSTNFILRLLKGETFNDICNNITPDNKVNECRKVYFRFK